METSISVRILVRKKGTSRYMFSFVLSPLHTVNHVFCCVSVCVCVLDSETALVPSSSIYSFSFGATRDFVITSKQSGATASGQRRVIPLTHGSLVIMGGEMQKYYKHAVPKRKACTQPRVNITFRLMKKPTVAPHF